MADNVNVTPGTGDVVAADDIAGVKFQRVKIVLGADGVNGGEVAALRTPVTSVRGFATYLQKIASTTRRPLSAVVTKISLVPDAKTQFKLNFDFVRTIDDMNVIKALVARGEKELEAAIATAGIEEDGAPEQAPAEKSGKY